MTRRLVLIVAAAVIAVPLAGAVYQALSARRDARRFPPPGTLVDVGGRRLHLLCDGDGEPTVVFESSGLGIALSARGPRARPRREWRRFRALLPQFAR